MALFKWPDSNSEIRMMHLSAILKRGCLYLDFSSMNSMGHLKCRQITSQCKRPTVTSLFKMPRYTPIVSYLSNRNSGVPPLYQLKRPKLWVLLVAERMDVNETETLQSCAVLFIVWYDLCMIKRFAAV